MFRKSFIFFSITLLFFAFFIPFSTQAEGLKKVKNVTKIYRLTYKIKLDWQPIKKTKYYQVKILNNKNKKIKVARINKSEGWISNLKANKKYYFKVRAVKGKNKGSWSKKIKAYTRQKVNQDIVLRGVLGPGFPDASEVNTASTGQAINIGANYQAVFTHYYFDVETEEFFLENSKQDIREEIAILKEAGQKIFFFPHFEPHIGTGVNDFSFNEVQDVEKFYTNLTAIALEWAQFCENNNVEMCAVAHNVTQFTNEEVDQWYADILPQFRALYSGDVVAKDADININYSGYDYVALEFCGMPPGTGSEYHVKAYSYDDDGNEVEWTGLASFDVYEQLTNNFMPTAQAIKDNYNLKGIILTDIYIDAIAGHHVEDTAEFIQAYQTVLEYGQEIIDGYIFLGWDTDSEIKQALKDYYLNN